MKTIFSILNKVLLLIISVLVFFLSHPNPLFENGLGFFGYFIYLPVLVIVEKSSLKTVFLWGGFYGSLSYGLFAFWLKNFHPLTLYIISIVYFLIFALVFVILKVIQKSFLVYFWIVSCIFLCAFEYLKTLGFCGFSYGVSAYTQWTNLYLIQICQITGVFGLNFLIIFPSSFIFGAYINYKNRNKIDFKNQFIPNKNKNFHINNFIENEKNEKKLSWKKYYICAALWLFLMCISYILGFYTINNHKKNAQNYNYVNVVAVQNNEDPWKNGLAEYSKNIKNLKNLTEETFDFYDKIDFVIWPETAVVPPVLTHYQGGKDKKRQEVILSLLKFINEKEAVFVIGNSYEQKNLTGNIDRYNSVFVFEPQKNVIPPQPEVYSKIHLVPFTEYFPFKEKFPKFYKRLLNGDTQMWEKGVEYKVFYNKNLNFSTPVCFEDTFGDDCRKFVKNGARAFFNLSNDAWSKSSVCQTQHLSMAVFRSVENKVPSVRSTSSGQTCIINEYGKVIAKAPAFCESYVIGKIPLLKDFTLSVYSRFGDYAGKIEVFSILLILIIKLFSVIIKKVCK